MQAALQKGFLVSTFDVERGGSKTHPVGPPAPSCQHPVLKLNIWLDLMQKV